MSIMKLLADWFGDFPLVIVSGASGAVAQGPPPLQPLDSGRVPYFIGEAEAGSRPGQAIPTLRAGRSRCGNAPSAGPFSSSLPRPSERRCCASISCPPLPVSTGEMRSLALDGRRGAAVFIRPDVSALGPDIARAARADALLRETIVYLTCLHELGHAVGLSHTDQFDDIMYFFGYGGDIVGFFDRYRRQLRSRDDIQKTSGLSAADARRVRELYAK